MHQSAILAPIALLASLGMAQASGGLWCDIVDHNLEFHVSATEPESSGYPLRLENTLQVFDAEAPKELQDFQFRQGDLMSHWHDGREGGSLKLRFARLGSGDESFNVVELIINAPRVDEGSFKGSYILRISPARPIRGKDEIRENGFVSCAAN
jgi:hypothetical protein